MTSSVSADPLSTSSLEGCVTPTVSGTLEEAIENGVLKSHDLAEEPVRFLCSSSPLTPRIHTPSSESCSSENALIDESGISNAGGGEWGNILCQSNARDPPSRTPSFSSLRGFTTTMDNLEWDKSPNDSSDIHDALKTPDSRYSPSPFGSGDTTGFEVSTPCGITDVSVGECNVDVSLQHGEMEVSQSCANSQAGLPMFDSVLPMTCTAGVSPASEIPPRMDFALSDISSLPVQPSEHCDHGLLSGVQHASLNSNNEIGLSGLSSESVPGVNDGVVYQQMDHNQLRQNLDALSRAGLSILQMPMALELDTAQRDGVREVFLNEFPESATASTEWSPELNETPRRRGRGRPPGSQTVSRPLVVPVSNQAIIRRGPGRPHGFKPIRRPGVKLGRPFGSTKRGIPSQPANRNTRQRVEQYHASGQSETTPLTPSIFDAMDGREDISPYEQARRQNIERNNNFLIDLGLEHHTAFMQPRQPRQPRMALEVATLNSVFVQGRYDGDCPGWVYVRPHHGYFKEAINSKRYVLGNAVKSKGVYQMNDLFRRYEVTRGGLNEEVLPRNFVEDQRPGQNVLSTLTSETGCNIFRRLTDECILKYLFIRDQRNPDNLAFGNFKYCRGLGESLRGAGFYVKYLKDSDFEALVARCYNLNQHYSHLPATPQSPAGYYYHDFDDPNFTRRYDCVPIMPKNSHIRNRDEECSDLDDDGCVD